MIDQVTLKKLAELSRLHLTGEEQAFYLQQLNAILGLKEKLQMLKTDIEPKFHSIEMQIGRASCRERV